MRLIRRAALVPGMLGVLGAACGCTCEPARDEAARAVAEEPVVSALPRATRDDLPAATPMLVLAVREDGFTVDNRAVVATWPESDRARVPDAALHEDVAASGEALEVPALAEAMRRARRIEESRAAGGGTPIAFALRVAPDVSWRRVSQALWNAGREGWTEPRVVLARDGREVVLALPPSRRAITAAGARRIEREVLAALGDAPDDPSLADEPIDVVTPTITITGALEVRITLRDQPLAPSCDATQAGGAPTVPPRDRHVDAATLARCLETARATEALAIADPPFFAFAAAPSVPFGEASAVLEALASRGEVSLRATP